MVESIYFLKPDWCGTHFAGLGRKQGLQPVTRATALRRWFVTRKAREMVVTLGIRPRGDGDNQTSLLFPNGSRIVGLPGMEGTVRGFSAVSLLLIDEAARLDDAMYKALRPMLAVGQGDLWLMSTPYGKRGFFYGAGSMIRTTIGSG